MISDIEENENRKSLVNDTFQDESPYSNFSMFDIPFKPTPS